MTERDFNIETLCCVPKHILVAALSGDYSSVPDWICRIPTETIQYTVNHYEDEYYQELRELSQIAD